MTSELGTLGKLDLFHIIFLRGGEASKPSWNNGIKKLFQDTYVIEPSPFLSNTRNASLISASASRCCIWFFIITRNSSKSTSPFPGNDQNHVDEKVIKIGKGIIQTPSIYFQPGIRHSEILPKDSILCPSGCEKVQKCLRPCWDMALCIRKVERFYWQDRNARWLL